jgi:hypothetical protein
MRIPSGKTDQVIYFKAVDPFTQADLTGLSSFTVYRSRNGGAATIYTTPTITELSAANMPGLYSLLVDEDTTIASASDSEEMALYITAATMAPVTKTFELYRRTATSGNTVLADSSGRVDVAKVAGTTQTAKDLGASVTQTGDSYARIGAAGAGLTALGDTRIANLDAAVTSRLASSSYTAPDNAGIALIETAVAALPTANANADALLDRSNGIETGWTLRQVMRIIFAVLAGKGTGLSTSSMTFRNVPDTKDRVVATFGSTGNRTAVTLDAS